MDPISFFLIAFGVGCLTGAGVGFWSRYRRWRDSGRSPPFWTLPADD